MKSLIIPLGMSIALATAADDVELAMKLSNPIADLISAPIQSNYDFGIGAGDGTRWTTNIQPVMPFSLTENWNLVSRTVLPVVDQQGVALGGAGDAFGLGDTVQSFFFSPKASSPIWGVGPAFLLPTATDDLLGGDQWGVGPTAVVLKQTGPWTYGALANHLWDFAGDSDRPGVNATFIQPFVAYTFPTATTLTLNLECTYDWRDSQWTVPVNFQVSQLVKFGSQPVQLFAGIRAYPEAPDDGPEWGVRFGMTFLFPKS